MPDEPEAPVAADSHELRCPSRPSPVEPQCGTALLDQQAQLLTGRSFHEDQWQPCFHNDAQADGKGHALIDSETIADGKSEDGNGHEHRQQPRFLYEEPSQTGSDDAEDPFAALDALPVRPPSKLNRTAVAGETTISGLNPSVVAGQPPAESGQQHHDANASIFVNPAHHQRTTLGAAGNAMRAESGHPLLEEGSWRIPSNGSHSTGASSFMRDDLDGDECLLTFHDEPDNPQAPQGFTEQPENHPSEQQLHEQLQQQRLLQEITTAPSLQPKHANTYCHAGVSLMDHVPMDTGRPLQAGRIPVHADSSGAVSQREDGCHVTFRDEESEDQAGCLLTFRDKDSVPENEAVCSREADLHGAQAENVSPAGHAPQHHSSHNSLDTDNIDRRHKGPAEAISMQRAYLNAALESTKASDRGADTWVLHIANVPLQPSTNQHPAVKPTAGGHQHILNQSSPNSGQQQQQQQQGSDVPVNAGGLHPAHDTAYPNFPQHAAADTSVAAAGDDGSDEASAQIQDDHMAQLCSRGHDHVNAPVQHHLRPAFITPLRPENLAQQEPGQSAETGKQPSEAGVLAQQDNGCELVFLDEVDFEEDQAPNVAPLAGDAMHDDLSHHWGTHCLQRVQLINWSSTHPVSFCLNRRAAFPVNFVKLADAMHGVLKTLGRLLNRAISFLRMFTAE